MKKILLVFATVALAGCVLWFKWPFSREPLGYVWQNRAVTASSRTVPLELPLQIPRIVVRKAERVLELYDGVRFIRRYPIGLGFTPVGDKVREGDGRTPEGIFYVCAKNAQSRYRWALGLSYPSRSHAERGRSEGRITAQQHAAIAAALARGEKPPWDTPLGGAICIHGLGAHRDWTLGCVALENEDAREVFNAVNLGTEVVIKP